MNKITIIGNLTKNPEPETKNGITMCEIGVADNYKTTKGESTNFFYITFFNEKQIETLQKYVSKGHQIYVEAEVRQSVGERDGVKTTYTNYIGRSFTLLNNKREETSTIAEAVEKPTITIPKKQTLTSGIVMLNNKREETSTRVDENLDWEL